MRRPLGIASFLMAASLVLLLAPGADAFRAGLAPSRINPGDAFVISVEGTQGEPSALMGGNPLPFTRCGDGCFLALGAVDVEAKPGTHRVTVRSGKRTKVLSLVVKRHHFASTRLTLPEEKVSLSPDDAARVEREADILKALWLGSSGRLWEGAFAQPLENLISTPFGIRRIINGSTTSIHRGIDIRGKDGEAVKASNTGRVVLVQELFFGGNTAVLDHGGGIFTVYMHLSAFSVALGDIVPKGRTVGLVGSTGRSAGPHLHFGVKVGPVSVNPQSFLKLHL